MQTPIDVALHAADAAIAVQRKYFTSTFTTRNKGAVDLVTTADLESQAAIVGIIEKTFPAHKILAEEDESGHAQKLDKGPLWIVDPLDGTTNFAHRFPHFGPSIAFLEDGVPQVAVVANSIAGEIFHATKGGGAFLQNKPLRVSQTQDINTALLATGFPYDRQNAQDDYLPLFAHFQKRSVGIRRAGAAAIDLAYVACGRFGAFWEAKLKPWDIAAGMLLVEEAGGICTDYAGEPIRNLWCSEMIASNKHIHAPMVEACSQHRITG